MKTKMSLIVGTVLLAAGSLAFAQGAKPQGAKPSDAQIAGIVTAANQIDINAGKLALKKATSPEVKQFAQQMVNDHTNLQKSVAALAKKLHVSPQDTGTSQGLHTAADAEMKKLQGLKGSAFDTEYINHEVAYHQQVISDMGSMLIPSAQNPEFKMALQGAVPLFQGHLAHAQMLQASMRK